MSPRPATASPRAPAGHRAPGSLRLGVLALGLAAACDPAPVPPADDAAATPDDAAATPDAAAATPDAAAGYRPPAPIRDADACDAAIAATARHVAPTGDDDAAGDAAAPWRTLGAALPRLRPGDTLCVHGGTYAEQVRNPPLAAGTAEAPVRVLGVAGERAVVEGLLWLRGASHWRFHRLDVTWSPGNGHDEHMVKLTDGTGWEFADAEVWGAESYAAILVAGAPADWALRRLYVHDTAGLEVTGHGVNQDHLVYVNAGAGGGVVERSLLVRSPNGRAIKLGPPACGAGVTANVVVRHNTMVDNLGPSNVQPSCEARDNRVERNLMVRPAPGRANVTGFQLTGAGNVVTDNVGWGTDEVADTAAGVVDGGGNLVRDPRFVDEAGDDFHPTDPVVAAYGVFAP